LGIELVDLREFGRLVRTKVLVRAVLSQNSVWGLPGTFHHTVLLHYGCQVRKVHYVTATHSIKESFVRAVSAEKRYYILLVLVLDLVKSKEKSGPVTVYRLLGLLPDTGETV